MERIRLEIFGLTYSQTQNNAYALILKEADGERRLPIIIGGFEAQSIAIQLEKIKYSRPLTHDLFKNFASAFSVNISEVVIYRLDEGVFYSNLICIGNDNVVKLDARTSDAVSLALRFGCPIYTFEEIMQTAAIDNTNASKLFENIDDEDLTLTEDVDDNSFTSYTDEQLQELLTLAVEYEDYEQASLIRDEQSRRKLII
ncbi:MAG: bifunctional nuclease family protein [Bacteroidota bacterium]|jgi:hypothetical protein